MGYLCGWSSEGFAFGCGGQLVQGCQVTVVGLPCVPEVVGTWSRAGTGEVTVYEADAGDCLDCSPIDGGTGAP